MTSNLPPANVRLVLASASATVLKDAQIESRDGGSSSASSGQTESICICQALGQKSWRPLLGMEPIDKEESAIHGGVLSRPKRPFALPACPISHFSMVVSSANPHCLASSGLPRTGLAIQPNPTGLEAQGTRRLCWPSLLCKSLPTSRRQTSPPQVGTGRGTGTGLSALRG